jgi:hypothetical protein
VRGSPAFIVSLLRALRDCGLEAIIVGNAAAAIQGAPVRVRISPTRCRSGGVTRVMAFAAVEDSQLLVVPESQPIHRVGAEQFVQPCTGCSELVIIGAG